MTYPDGDHGLDTHRRERNNEIFNWFNKYKSIGINLKVERDIKFKKGLKMNNRFFNLHGQSFSNTIPEGILISFYSGKKIMILNREDQTQSIAANKKIFKFK